MSVVKVCRLVSGTANRKRRGSLGKEWKRFYLVAGRVTIELAGKSGYGYSAWAFTSAARGEVRLWDADSYVEMVAMRKKRKPDAVSAVQHVAAVETSLLHTLMPIIEHCAMTQYEDGDSRKPGWVQIKTFGSVWQVEAKDPDTCQFLRVTQPTIDDALVLLALLLAQEDAPWERDTWAEQQQKKSKK